jgi:hypothetical protein
MDIEDEFVAHYKQCLNKEYPAGRSRDRLSISSFPYCGLRHAYSNLLDRQHSSTFLSSYYFGVGHVLHDNLQHFLGFGQRMYGSWKCTVPKCGGSRLFSNINTCPTCKSVMQFREMRVGPNKQWPNISIGFIDGLYRSMSKKWYLVDYKSTSLEHLKVMEVPDSANLAQVKSYCPLVEMDYSIEVEGWILVYVARDKPNKIKVFTGSMSEKNKKKQIASIDTNNRHFQIVKSDPSWKDVKVLIAEKPCTSPEFYKKYYAGYSGCPLSGVCFGSELKPYVKKVFTASS